MKFLIVFVALFAVALAAPPTSDAAIISQSSEVLPESFKFNFETSDGQAAEAGGVLNNVGTDHESLAVHGSYRFVAPDGQTFTVEYVADENGFQPQGAHLPVA